MSQQLPANFRPSGPDDYHYILSTWSKQILPLEPFSWMGKQAWKKHHDIMEVATSQEDGCLVAVNPEDDGHILGYIVFDPVSWGKPFVIHWIYTKYRMRGLGLGRRLVGEAFKGESEFSTEGLIYSHQCEFAEKNAKRYGLDYDPFAFWAKS